MRRASCRWKKTVIMYDTPVSNEFIRVCGWSKEHLLSHTNIAFTARHCLNRTTNHKKCEKCFAIKVIRYRKRVYFSHGEVRKTHTQQHYSAVAFVRVWVFSCDIYFKKNQFKGNSTRAHSCTEMVVRDAINSQPKYIWLFAIPYGGRLQHGVQCSLNKCTSESLLYFPIIFFFELKKNALQTIFTVGSMDFVAA